MRVSVPALVCLLFLLAPAAAEDEKPPKGSAQPPTAEQAADQVLEAAKAKDAPALKTLAEKNEPDPWLVADELCFRGAQDAAEAFSKASPRAATEKLPAYVESRRGRTPDDDERRLRLTLTSLEQASSRALATRDPKVRSELLEGMLTDAAEWTEIPEGVLQLAFGLRYVNTLLRLGRHEEAIAVGQELAPAARELGWLRQAGEAYGRVGDSARFRSDLTLALMASEEAVRLFTLCDDARASAAMLVSMGRTYADLSDYPNALATLLRASKEFERTGSQIGIAVGHLAMGNAYRDVADTRSALKSLQYADAILEREGGDPGLRGQALSRIAQVYLDMGDYAKALTTYEQAMSRWMASGRPRRALNVRLNTASVYANLGNHDKALEIYEEVRAEQLSRGLKLDATESLRLIGELHARRGDHELALTKLRQAREDRAAAGPSRVAASILDEIARAHLELGDTGAALKVLDQARLEKEALQDRRGGIESLLVAARAEEERGGHVAAAALYQQALDKAKAARAKRLEIRVLIGRGNHLHARGDDAGAREELRRAASAARSIRATVMYIRAQRDLAQLHLDMGEPAAALGAARQGLDAAERLFSDLGEESGAQARGRYGDLFGIGVLAAVQDEDAAAAVTFMESGRAGALLDNLDSGEAFRPISSCSRHAIPQEVRW